MATAAMDTMSVGKRLVELCGQGKHIDAIQELYADTCVSVEAAEGPGMPRVTEGKEAILKGAEWWMNTMEMHDSGMSQPYPHDNRFIINMWTDVTAKEGPMAGQRMKMDEMAVYTVEAGKITRAEFFYDMDCGEGG